MRTARAFPVGLALAFAPGWARAEPPRVSARLEYTRGPGGETCPAEPTALRGEVARRMGYDPFDGPPADGPPAPAPDRVVVVVSRGDRGGFAAHVERFDAAGARTWSETFPAFPLQGECAGLFSPLASYLRGLLLSYQRTPAAPPPEPAAPAPSLLPAPATPIAAPAQPANPPEPPNIPNPTRITARNVAIVAFTLGGVFLGLAIGWTVHAQDELHAAQTLSAQAHRAGGDIACYSGGPVSSGDCGRLLAAWQGQDAALNFRNGWFAAAGASAAIGAVATVWAVNLPMTIKGPPQTQIRLSPGGLVLSGSF
jgi:hypothetical protein